MSVEEFIEDLPFISLLGIELKDVGDGSATGSLEMLEELSWKADELLAHGGVTFTLAEATGAAAIAELRDPPVFTIDARTDYLDLAQGDLIARADVVRDGGDIGVADVTVTDERDEAVAKISAVYKV
jgi:uncharacterized protein (TIGR00369 family)